MKYSDETDRNNEIDNTKVERQYSGKDTIWGDDGNSVMIIVVIC